MGRESTSLPLPAAIGRFRIESLLGRGGMGEVYKAFDPTLQRTVAVKTVRPDRERPEYLERMMREAQACARLSHPNIVTVYEAGQVDGVVFIAMEYLQGRNLDEALEAGRLSFEEKIRILAKVLEALDHAHAQDVVHRDIKPSNIHLQSDGAIKLMDFGLARVLEADTLTASGNVLGTPHYASPEQLKGEPVDRRTDVYSVGVMAYEMLSGRRPFEPDPGSSSVSVIFKVIQQPAAPMDSDVTRRFPEIESIVSRAMAKTPDGRFQSAGEMRAALLSFLEQSRDRLSVIESQADRSTVIRPSPAQPIPAAPLSSALSEKTSRRLWWAGGAAAAALIAVVVMAMPSNPGTGSPSTSLRASREPGTAPPGPGAANPVAAAAPAPAAASTATNDPASAPGSRIPVPDSAGRKPADPTAASAHAAQPTEATTAAPPAADAKEMFDSTAGTVAPGLRFRLIQAGPNDVPMDVDPAKEFHSGDRVRFAFESNIDGYLYVAQIGSSGYGTVLFPAAEINGGRNTVKRHQEYEVPQGGDWFQFDQKPGVEELLVFLSREPMTTLPGFDRPVMKSYERASPALVAELQGRIQSRDLVFTKAAAGKGQQATYVVNKAEVGKAVTASFTLTHK